MGRYDARGKGPVAEMTLEQRRAVALATARLRLQGQKGAAPREPFVPSGEKTTGPWGEMFGYDPQALGLTPAENIAGHPVTRFAMGAASPILGLAQIGAELLGDKTGTETLAQVEELKKRGMAAMGAGGTDLTGVAGTVLSPPFLMSAKALKTPTTIAGRVGQGAVVGGLAGASAPVSDEGADYWATKGGQTLLGLAAGAAIPGVLEAGKAVGRAVRSIADMFTEAGAGRILTRYQRRIVGDENVPAVVERLRSPPPDVAGYQQTAAERLTGTPAGSPLAAHQRITAQTPGGISGQFGERFQQQKSALQAAAASRDEELLPLANNILTQANKTGVKADSVTSRIDDLLNQPGKRASDVVQRTLKSVKSKIDETAEHGLLDARDLWTIRKEIGNTIKTHAKETANWDKRMTAGLERDIQREIDSAIEAAGGTGWKQFMAEYARRSRAIEAAKEAAKTAYRPAQRTELGGGVNVAEETRLAAPNLLSRPMMATNFVLRKLGAGVEQRLDPEAARRYLDPNRLANALESIDPRFRGPVVQQLIDLGYIPPLAGGVQASVREGP